jgi:hypothetical protein
MAGITTYLSILTLNVNRLNFPIKRHLLANWIKKENPTKGERPMATQIREE